MNAFSDSGFLFINEEFIFKHIKYILFPENKDPLISKYEHIYYDYGLSTEKRIVSIERQAVLTSGWNNDDVVNNAFTIRAELKYY